MSLYIRTEDLGITDNPCSHCFKLSGIWDQYFDFGSSFVSKSSIQRHTFYFHKYYCLIAPKQDKNSITVIQTHLYYSAVKCMQDFFPDYWRKLFLPKRLKPISMLAFNLKGVVWGQKPITVILELPVARHSVHQTRIFSYIINQSFYYSSVQNLIIASLQFKIKEPSFKTQQLQNQYNSDVSSNEFRFHQAINWILKLTTEAVKPGVFQSLFMFNWAEAMVS